MDMHTHTREPAHLPQETESRPTETPTVVPGGTPPHATQPRTPVHSGCHPEGTAPKPTTSIASPAAPDTTPRKVSRGLAAQISTLKLKQGICLRTLLTAHRFRVIRTIDVAVCCFAERPFKAALTAAQRAMRGMVKAELLRRYRTDRFQTVYGLTQKGVDWLEDAGFEASSSVRRVSDMTNPEHRLWAQFWTLACEARGLAAMTEQELLQSLNKDTQLGQPLVQGLLTVTTMRGQKTNTVQLRPDAVASEPDGTTWLEVDRSKRGSDREASLGALCLSIGRPLKDGSTLRRVVIFCKSERIYKRAIAVVNELAKAHNGELLVSGRRHFLPVEPGSYAVWTGLESQLKDGRTKPVDTLVGHVLVQMLPIWLPKVRIDASNTHSLAGWFDENYLPYRRPNTLPAWGTVASPLLSVRATGSLVET